VEDGSVDISGGGREETVAASWTFWREWLEERKTRDGGGKTIAVPRTGARGEEGVGRVQTRCWTTAGDSDGSSCRLVKLDTKGRLTW